MVTGSLSPKDESPGGAVTYTGRIAPAQIALECHAPLVVQPDSVKRAWLHTQPAAIASLEFEDDQTALLILNEGPGGASRNALCIPAHAAVGWLEHRRLYLGHPFVDPDPGVINLALLFVDEGTGNGTGAATCTVTELDS
jgi:hypothetical protein